MTFFRRFISISLPLIWIFTNTVFGLVHPASTESAAGVGLLQAAGVRMVASTPDDVVLELSVPTYEIERETTGAGSDERIVLPGIPGVGMTAEPGSPELPLIGALIGAPPGANYEIELLRDDARLLPGTYDLRPAPKPVSLMDDLQPGEMRYERNVVVYMQKALYPQVPVQIVEEAWVRNQRVLRLAFYPVQYRPAERTLLWHRLVRVRVRFVGGSAASYTWQTSNAGLEPLLKGALLNYDQARAWRAALPSARSASPGIPLVHPSNYQPLGPRYKIVVDQDGIYHLTYQELKDAGMEVESLAPATFHMTSQGEEVAIYISGELDGSFDPGDEIVFYGEKFQGERMAARYGDSMLNDHLPANNWLWLCSGCELAGMFERYTDENVYWLTSGEAPGARMTTVNGRPSDLFPVPEAYTATVRLEESNHWWSHEFQDQDVWFGDQIRKHISQLPYTSTYPITLTAVATGNYTATVHAEVASRASSFDTPNHHTRFTINEHPKPLDDAYWSGKIRYPFNAHVPQSALAEGVNELHFTLLEDVMMGVTRMYFDWAEIEYARAFWAEGDQITFARPVSGTWQYEVENFTSNAIEVYDISDPLAPKRVLSSTVSGSGPYDLTFGAEHGGEGRYIAVGAEALKHPKRISFYDPPDFAAMPETDYLLISHADFIDALQPLADYRTAQGLRTAIVDIEDLYQEFNDGIYHPIAIKSFLAYTFQNWESPPLYVALIGDGHWNFKSHGETTYGEAPPIFVPPNLAYVDPWQGEVDSANLLATLVGDDTLPDLHIARIPVNSVSELEAVIAKTLAYEKSPRQDWQRSVLFIADNIPDPNNAGDFIALSEGIINDYLVSEPYFQADRIYLNDFGCSQSNTPECAEVTHAITNTLNTTGALIVNYIGHASIERWSHEQVFRNEHVPELTNMGKIPVLLSMTCLDGYWIYPNRPNLAAEMLRASEGGAVVTFSATGLGVATGHDYLQRGFFQSLFEDGVWEMGPATLAGKLQLFSAGVAQDLMHTFTTFGDPALRILNPYEVGLNPDQAYKKGEAGTRVAYSLELTNGGAISDTFVLTATGASWKTAVEPALVEGLAPGEGTFLTVQVDIPEGEPGGSADTVIVRAVSQGASYKKAQARLRTSVPSMVELFLPVILRE